MYCTAYTTKKRRNYSSKSSVIKLIAVFFLSISLQVNASNYSQKVTMSTKDASLKSIFMEIEKQTGYHFIYTSETLRNCLKVSLDVKEATLKFTLDEAFKHQPLTYVFMDKNIVVKAKTKPIVTNGFPSNNKKGSSPKFTIGVSGSDKNVPLTV